TRRRPRETLPGAAALFRGRRTALPSRRTPAPRHIRTPLRAAPSNSVGPGGAAFSRTLPARGRGGRFRRARAETAGPTHRGGPAALRGGGDRAGRQRATAAGPPVVPGTVSRVTERVRRPLADLLEAPGEGVARAGGAPPVPGHGHPIGGPLRPGHRV